MRAVRIILKVLAVAVFAIAVLAGAAIALLHTHWGKEQARTRSEKLINGMLAGHVSIGSIEGSFFDHLTLRNVALDDASGRPALRADVVSIDFDLFSLFDKLALIEEVVIERPRALLVTEADGTLNVTKLMKPAEPEEPKPPSEPSEWTVRVDSALLHGGDVRYVGADVSTIAASAIELAANAKIAGENIAVEVKNLAANVAEPAAADLALSFKATKTGLEAELRDLILQLDAQKIAAVDRANYHLESQGLDASFAIAASRDVLVRFSKDQNLRSGVALTGRVRHAAKDAPWLANLSGNIGAAPMTASATAASDFSGGALNASISGFNPNAVYATLPPGRVALKLDADVKGKTLKDLEGAVALEGAGTIQKYRISKLELDATAKEGRIDADLALHNAAAAVDAKARVDMNTEPLTITGADIKARVKQVAAFLPKKTGIRGALDADLHASGSVNALRAGGTVNVRKFSANAGAAHVDRARLRFDLRRSPKLITVNVRELFAAEKGFEAKMRDAEIMLANNTLLTVKNAKIDTNAGDADLDLNIHLRRLSKGPGEMTLALRDLDLPRLRNTFFPDAPQLTGIAAGDLTARFDDTGPHLTFKGTAHNVSILKPKPTPRMALDLSASLEGPAAHAQLAVTAKDMGTVNALADVRAPGDPKDPATWAKLTEQSLERALIEMKEISVKSLVALSQPAEGTTGTINGEIELLKGAENVRADVRVAGVRADPLPAPIDLHLLTATKDGRIISELNTSMESKRIVNAVVSVEHDLDRLKKEGFASFAGADLDGKITLDSFPMVMLADAIEAAASMKKAAEPGTRAFRRSEKGKRLGLGTIEDTSGLDGVASAFLTFKRRERETSARFELHGRDLVWVNDAPKLDLEMIATLEKGKLEAKGFGRGKAVGGLNLEATLELPRDMFDGAAWARVNETAIQTALFQFEELKLGEVDKIAKKRLGVRGTIDGEAKIAKGARFIEADIELEQVRTTKMQHGVDGMLTARVDQKGSMIGVDTSHEGAKMLVGKIATSASIADLLRGGPETISRQKIDGELTIEKLPMPLLAEMLRSQHDMTGAFSGRAKVFGLIGAPAVELELDGAGAKIDEHNFRELAIKVKIDPSRAEAEAKIVEAKGGRLNLSADLGRKVDQRSVKAHVESSKFPLGWITALIPPTLSIGGIDGRLDASVDLTGQLGDPNVQGKLELTDLKIGFAPPAPTIERTKMTMTFEGRKIAMNMDGHSDDGGIKAELTADLKRLDAPDFDARITTDELPIAAGPKRLLLDSVTRIKGRTDEVMTIEVVVENGRVDIPNEGSEQYRPIAKLDDVIYEGQEPIVEVEEGEAFPKMEILVGLRKQIPIYGEEINAVGDVELKLDNKSGAMEMSGYATVGNGYLNLFGKRWQIQQGRIDFIRGEDPRVQVELTHDFETAFVYVRVLGSPEHPELIVTSDPPIYDEAQLLMFVLGSGPNEDPKQTSVGQQAAGVAANALLGEVQSKIEDELPIDMLELEVGDSAQLSRLRLGRWLTSRIFLGYDYDFEAEEDENSNEAVLQYRLGRGWMVESRYGDRGNGGVDAVWVKRF